jgi:hypothetical protein
MEDADPLIAYHGALVPAAWVTAMQMVTQSANADCLVVIRGERRNGQGPAGPHAPYRVRTWSRAVREGRLWRSSPRGAGGSAVRAPGEGACGRRAPTARRDRVRPPRYALSGQPRGSPARPAPGCAPLPPEPDIRPCRHDHSACCGCPDRAGDRRGLGEFTRRSSALRKVPPLEGSRPAGCHRCAPGAVTSCRSRSSSSPISMPGTIRAPR